MTNVNMYILFLQNIPERKYFKNLLRYLLFNGHFYTYCHGKVYYVMPSILKYALQLNDNDYDFQKNHLPTSCSIKRNKSILSRFISKIVSFILNW